MCISYAKIVQTRAMGTCSQMAECSLSYAKIQLFCKDTTKKRKKARNGQRILLPADLHRTRQPFGTYATIKPQSVIRFGLKYRNNLYRNLHCFLRPAMPSVANTPFSHILRNALTINHLPFLQLVQPFCFHILHCEKPRFEA